MPLTVAKQGNSERRLAQSAETAKYTDCISAEGQDSPKECPGYDIKQSEVKASVILELWGIRITPSLLSVPGQLWPGMVAPDRVLSMGQIERNCVITLNRIVSN